MRSSFYLAAFAQFGTAATWATPSSHLGLASAFLFVYFALFAIGYVVERGWNEPAPVSAIPSPKLVGLPAHAPVPPGWSPVYVHRPAGPPRDHWFDYRVCVDGTGVGTVGPGETFLVCLTPGEHTVRGRIREHSSPPLNLRLADGEAVHLVLEPDRTDLEALPKLFDKARYLRITRRDSPWRGPGAGVRQVIQ